jgi:hypothetical protein
VSTVTNEDLCANCKNCSLMKPPHGHSWEVPAICTAGWPVKMFWNVRSDCEQYWPHTKITG